jgi:hypothetical protein
MTILRQIKELKTEYATIHSHVLRRVVQIKGCIPLILDPKKPLRRTLLPGWLVIGGLPHSPSRSRGRTGLMGVPHAFRLIAEAPCADERAAKAAPPQNGADRGLSNPQLSRNLVVRVALLAQRLDLLGQPPVDNLAPHGNLPRSRLLGG